MTRRGTGDRVGRKLSLFLSAGIVGFAVDAIIFFALIYGFGASPLVGRICASLVAMSATWLLNRSFAFREGRMRRRLTEFVKYLVASFIGALANTLILLYIFPLDGSFYHVPAYVMGAAAGLFVNFILYDRIVFSENKSRNYRFR